MDTHRVFVYGSLQRGQPNSHMLENPNFGVAKHLGRGETVHAWPMIIASRYNNAYLLFAQGQGQRIQGDIFEVDDAMLAELDKFEKHPIVYQRDRLTVRAPLVDDGSNTPAVSDLECWAYFLKNYKESLLFLPTQKYFDVKTINKSYVLTKDRLPIDQYNPALELMK